MVQEEIKKLLADAITAVYRKTHGREFYGIGDITVLVEKPNDVTHGNYASSIALVLAKRLQQNPVEVAKNITDHLPKNSLIEKVQVAPPGFINFYLSRNYFTENLKTILKEKENFGSNTSLKKKKVIIEYTDPNPFKAFHIGHLMSNSIGESLSRIFEVNGATVRRANYQGDVGLHVAKAVWGLYETNQVTPIQNLDIAMLGQAYVRGVEAFEKNEGEKKGILEINKIIYKEKPDEPENQWVKDWYDNGRKISLDYFETIYKKLGTRFDYFFFESQIASKARKIVEDGLKKNVFETGDRGAIVFKGEKYGLHTRVFINAEGLPTYEAKELALAKEKYKKFEYDQSVVVTANEITEYFKVLLAAMAQIFPELAKKTTHVGHGMMRLPEGKMSSRTGNVVTFESLLSQVETVVLEKIVDRGFNEAEKKEVTEKVAIAALKYSILKQSIGGDIVYDMNKSVSFEGDSGPYLQYSYARAKSVLAKAKQENVKPSLKKTPAEISQLEKSMSYFPETVEKAYAELQPHYILQYLTELAREFNSYYAHHKIVEAADDGSAYKVALAEAFSIIMKRGLWMLGIETLEKM